MSGEAQQYSRRGVTPRALHQIFEQVDIHVDRQITVKVSFVEVYNEVRAILAPLMWFLPASARMCAQHAYTRMQHICRQATMSKSLGAM